MRRKRTVKPNRYRSVGIAMFFVVSAIAAIAVVAAEWRSSVTGVELHIRGVRITTVQDIRAAVALNDSSRLADLDLLAIRERIMRNPYVRDVDVMRDPPERLIVEVKERVPITMLVNTQGRDWLVDEHGYVLPMAKVIAGYDVPLLTGMTPSREIRVGTRIIDRKVQRALQVLRAMRGMDKTLWTMFSEINISRDRDVLLYTLEAGVPVILGPPQRIEEKLLAFRAFWENVAMKLDPSSLEYVDLRWKDQVVTRRRGTPMPDDTAASDSTAVDSVAVQL